MNKKQNKILQATMTLAYHDHLKSLNGLAYFKVNNHELGNDLVQETFLKTWVYLVKGGKIDTMKAFLYHILNNLIIDQYRKRKTSSLDLLLESGFEPKDESSGNFLNILDGKIVLRLIPCLPILYRNIIHMRFVQDLSIEEMSEISGQTKNAIAVKIHRGLEKLRMLYEKRSGSGKPKS